MSGRTVAVLAGVVWPLLACVVTLVVGRRLGEMSAPLEPPTSSGDPLGDGRIEGRKR